MSERGFQRLSSTGHSIFQTTQYVFSSDADMSLMTRLCYPRTPYSSKTLSSKRVRSSCLGRFTDGNPCSTTRWMIQVIGQGGTVFAHCSSMFILPSDRKTIRVDTLSCTTDSRHSIVVSPRHRVPHGCLQSGSQRRLLPRPGPKVLRINQSSKCDCHSAVQGLQRLTLRATLPQTGFHVAAQGIKSQQHANVQP